MTQRPVATAEQRRAEWVQRIEGYARDAAPKTRPYAEALVGLVAPEPGERVLDIATGTGVVAVEAALRVGPDGSVQATDLVPEWESLVAATAAAAGVQNVSFAAMPSESLALPDASFDVVLCQFGLMFADDPLRALREMWRVLRPGGKLGITVWSVPERLDVFLLTRLVGAALPPPVEEPVATPWRLGAPGLIEGFVADAGFRDVALTPLTLSFVVDDAAEEWNRWKDSGNPVAQALAALPEGQRAQIRERAFAALEALRDDEGIRVASEALLVTAVR
jgi:ubiquinone/menaquinone biosynthesis C-methylase UbiE